MKTPPLCAKCDTSHWRFTKCEDAPAEVAKAQAAAAEAERKKVMPIWRNDNDRAWNNQPGWQTARNEFHRNEFVNPKPPEGA